MKGKVWVAKYVTSLEATELGLVEDVTSEQKEAADGALSQHSHWSGLFGVFWGL